MLSMGAWSVWFKDLEFVTDHTFSHSRRMTIRSLQISTWWLKLIRLGRSSSFICERKNCREFETWIWFEDVATNATFPFRAAMLSPDCPCERGHGSLCISTMARHLEWENITDLRSSKSNLTRRLLSDSIRSVKIRIVIWNICWHPMLTRWCGAFYASQLWVSTS